MSTLQLLLELRARQTAAIQADSIRHQRRHPIPANTTSLRKSASFKTFDPRILLLGISAPLYGTLPVQPKVWNATNLIDSITNGTRNHVGATGNVPFIVQRSIAASYAPARAKRCSLNKVSSSNSMELHNGKKSDKNYSKWLDSYDSLTQFQKRHGHCIVPRNYKITTLACWVRQTLT